MLKSRFLLTLAASALLLSPVVAAPSVEGVELEEIRPNVYLHRSYLQTDDFGLVDCNGLVYVSNGEALVIDTPCNVAQTEALIEKIESELKSTVTGVVIGHRHADSMGGLQAFASRKIPSYSSISTQQKARDEKLPLPVAGFDSQLEVRVGDKLVRCGYFGPGHTEDNTVTYLVEEKVLFGDCLIKAQGASEGYLGDAKPEQWSATVEKVRKAYPDVEVVVPGHGAVGDRSLLDYTIELFSKRAATP